MSTLNSDSVQGKRYSVCCCLSWRCDDVFAALFDVFAAATDEYSVLFTILHNVFSNTALFRGWGRLFELFFFFKNWLGYIASNCRKRLPLLKRHKSMCPNCFSKLWGKQWNFGGCTNCWVNNGICPNLAGAGAKEWRCLRCVYVQLMGSSSSFSPWWILPISSSSFTFGRVFN